MSHAEERRLNAHTDVETDAEPPARAAAPAEAAPARPVKPERPKGALDEMPPFKVLLHNDNLNDMGYVVETLMDLTPLDPSRATMVMFEAHHSGVALVLTTHRERAELYQDQFRSKGLKVTIEPAA